MITIVYAKTRMLCIFLTSSKQPPVRIICFILKLLKNETHTYRRVIVSDDGALENSTDVTNLLVKKLE